MLLNAPPLTVDFSELHRYAILDRSLSREDRQRGLLVDSLVNAGPKSLVHRVQFLDSNDLRTLSKLG